VVHDLLAALGVERFTIRINDRRVLGGVLERLGLADRGPAVLRSLDKLAKAGPEAVARELAGQGVAPEAVAALLEMAGLAGPPAEVLAGLTRLVGGTTAGEAGVAALEALVGRCGQGGVAAGRIAVDPSIARGLDYYTGLVIETFLDDLPSLGSVCSGGRYDDLAGLYTRQPLPGIGASLGLDRLLAGLEELAGPPTRQTPADLFLACFAERHLPDYLRIAAALRHAGVAVEFFPEPKKLGQQLSLADRRGFPLALVIGPDEFAAGTAQLKDMAAKTSTTVAWHGDPAALVAAVQAALATVSR